MIAHSRSVGSGAVTFVLDGKKTQPANRMEHNSVEHLNVASLGLYPTFWVIIITLLPTEAVCFQWNTISWCVWS
jgi:hypothetical protein